MRETLINSYHLTAAAVQQLATLPTHGLKPQLTTLNEVAPYTALDDFDQSLRRAGQLLLEAGKTLELIENDGRTMTQTVQGPIAFPGDIPDGGLRQSLKHVSALRRLLPIGTGLWQRAMLTFSDETQAIHCDIQLVFLTGEHDQAAAVAVLPATTDHPESLSVIRDRILELKGSKFTGSALVDALFPLQQAYDAKPELPVAAAGSAINAANAIISTLIPVARANEPGIIADHDTEFLHDYRIQLRKIRSVLSLFKEIYDESQTKHLKAEFSTIMASTGALRDLDVCLLDKPKYYGLLPKSLHAGLDTLFDMFARNRKAEQAKLASHLSSKQYKKQISQLASLFTAPGSPKPGPAADLPGPAYAQELIWKRYRKACKLAGNINPESSDEKLHSLRIHCKKVRYLMESFSPLYPPEQLKAQRGALKKLQDTLGRFNDSSMQQQSLIKALGQLPLKRGVPDIEAAQCIGALIVVLHNRQQQEREKVIKSLARFNRDKTQKAFRKLLQRH